MAPKTQTVVRKKHLSSGNGYAWGILIAIAIGVLFSALIISKILLSGQSLPTEMVAHASQAPLWAQILLCSLLFCAAKASVGSYLGRLIDWIRHQFFDDNVFDANNPNEKKRTWSEGFGTALGFLIGVSLAIALISTAGVSSLPLMAMATFKAGFWQTTLVLFAILNHGNTWSSALARLMRIKDRREECDSSGLYKKGKTLGAHHLMVAAGALAGALCFTVLLATGGLAGVTTLGLILYAGTFVSAFASVSGYTGLALFDTWKHLVEGIQNYQEHNPEHSTTKAIVGYVRCHPKEVGTVIGFVLSIAIVATIAATGVLGGLSFVTAALVIAGAGSAGPGLGRRFGAAIAKFFAPVFAPQQAEYASDPKTSAQHTNSDQSDSSKSLKVEQQYQDMARLVGAHHEVKPIDDDAGQAPAAVSPLATQAGLFKYPALSPRAKAANANYYRLMARAKAAEQQAEDVIPVTPVKTDPFYEFMRDDASDLSFEPEFTLEPPMPAAPTAQLAF